MIIINNKYGEKYILSPFSVSVIFFLVTWKCPQIFAFLKWVKIFVNIILSDFERLDMYVNIFQHFASGPLNKIHIFQIFFDVLFVYKMGQTRFCVYNTMERVRCRTDDRAKWTFPGEPHTHIARVTWKKVSNVNNTTEACSCGSSRQLVSFGVVSSAIIYVLCQKMSFDSHIIALGKLCRICGNRLINRSEKDRTPLQCCEFTKDIFAVFGISTWEDTREVHPPCFCDKCGRKIRHYQAGTRSYNTSNSSSSPREWSKHARVNCSVCTLFSKQSRPGRPPKTKRGKPRLQPEEKEYLEFGLSEVNIFPTSQCQKLTETCINLSIVGREEEQSVFTCPICLCILSSPSIQTSCEHYFCAQCFTRYFQHQLSSSAPCPVCKAIVKYNEVCDSPRALRVQLQNLIVVCDNCTQIGKFSELHNHSCKTSKAQVSRKEAPIICETTVPSKRDQDILQAANLLRTEAINHTRGTPIPYAIEQATDRWTWHKLQQGDRVASLKTGGRVS